VRHPTEGRHPTQISRRIVARTVAQGFEAQTSDQGLRPLPGPPIRTTRHGYRRAVIGPPRRSGRDRKGRAAGSGRANIVPARIKSCLASKKNIRAAPLFCRGSKPSNRALKRHPSAARRTDGSRFSTRLHRDCFVASLLAMTPLARHCDPRTAALRAFRGKQSRRSGTRYHVSGSCPSGKA